MSLLKLFLVCESIVMKDNTAHVKFKLKQNTNFKIFTFADSGVFTVEFKSKKKNVDFFFITEWLEQWPFNFVEILNMNNNRKYYKKKYVNTNFYTYILY